MNKRQSKKQYKRLYIAVKELNEDVAKDLEEVEAVTHEDIEAVCQKLWGNPHKVREVLEDHRRFILKEEVV